MAHRTRMIGNPLFIVAACALLITGTLWLAFRPAVADHFGYALPLDNRLPTRISYRGRHYQDVWPCGGAHCRGEAEPDCITKRTLMNRDPRPLVQVGSIPTLFGAAHSLLGLPGPGTAVLLFASVHSCSVTYSLSGARERHSTKEEPMSCPRAIVRTALLVGLVVLPHARAAAMPLRASNLCPGKTPADIVRHYYRYAAQRNAQGAQACLSAPYRTLLHNRNMMDPDWVNIASMRLLHMKQEQVPPKYQPGNLPVPAELFQVVVTYIVHYRVVESQPNGRGLSFVYVAKQTRHSPWRITGIGSGP